jgi:hypothetical protein
VIGYDKIILPGETDADTIARLAEDNHAMRLALSAVATAIGNGSFAAPECTVGFLCGVSSEVALVTADRRAEIERLRALLARDCDECGEHPAKWMHYTLLRGCCDMCSAGRGWIRIDAALERK